MEIKLVNTQIERGSAKVAYGNINARYVSRIPIAPINKYNGLTVAMGGNIDMDRTRVRKSFFRRILNIANENADNIPINRQYTVVAEATIKLFNIILAKGLSVNTDK